MFPLAIVRTPQAFSISVVSSVVVVFPFVPVMATAGHEHSSNASSSSPMIGIFFLTTFCTRATAGSMPGLRMAMS